MGIFEGLWEFWIVPFIIVLSVLVFVHEFGHYWVARRAGVRVETFSIGFGPEIFGWYDSAQTRWKVSVLPLGGYVKMYGEGDFDEEEERELTPEEKAVSFHHKSLRARAAVVAAGPLANFLFAFLIFAGVSISVGDPAPLSVVGSVQEDSAAEEAGFEAGDTIVSVDGEPIRWFADIQQAVSDRPGEEITFVVRRGDTETTLLAAPRPTTVTQADGVEQQMVLLGIRADATNLGYEEQGIITSIVSAAERVVGVTWQILNAVWQIITGTRTAEELGGPLRIAQLSGEVAQHGVLNLLFFMATLSINLGLINLFPIPMLDGGHLVFYAWEAVRGKRVNRRVQEYGLRLGLAFVIFLMLFATWNDLVQLKVFDFLRDLVS
jgi:regulator of sigma E protease